MPQKPTISSLQVQLTESDSKMEKIQDLFIKFADKQTDLAQAQAALKSEIDNSIIPAIADINNKAEERHKRTEDFFTKLGNKLEENSRVIASLSSRQPPVCEGDAQAVEVIAKQAVAEAVAGASDEGQNPVVKKRMDELVMQVKHYETREDRRQESHPVQTGLLQDGHQRRDVQWGPSQLSSQVLLTRHCRSSLLHDHRRVRPDAEEEGERAGAQGPAHLLNFPVSLGQA